MRELHLFPRLDDVPLGVRRSCQLVSFDQGAEVDRRELWFELPRSERMSVETDCDAHLRAVLMDAMQEKRDIIVHGSVSRSLLGNLDEFQAAWHKWLPDLYHTVDIRPDHVREDALGPAGAICAFSGGVDATFSVLRHSRMQVGHRSQEIRHCVLVHGFDIPLVEHDQFRIALANANRLLLALGIETIPIRTNYRLVIKSNWEHAFASAVVAALDNLKHLAGNCLLGSSEPYDSLVVPWGSSPITDHLLSSVTFRVLHDGASHSRTEKVAAIAEWPEGRDNLRVCWEGEEQSKNCGRCEKCLRTMLNFLATGNDIPACFPHPEKMNAHMRRVLLRNEAVLAEWRQILEYADAHHVRGQWRRSAAWVVRRSAIYNALLPQGSRRKAFLRRIFRLMRRQNLRPA